MEKQYINDLIIRQIAVQAIYKNMFYFESIDSLLNGVLFKVDNLPFFKQIVSLVVSNMENYSEDLSSYLNNKEEYDDLSACAQAVLFCAYAEINMNKQDKKLIINEYLKIAKMFCIKEVGFINKILDKVLNKNVLDKISID